MFLPSAIAVFARRVLLFLTFGAADKIINFKQAIGQRSFVTVAEF